MKKIIASHHHSLENLVAMALIEGLTTGHTQPVQQVIDTVLYNSRQWSRVASIHVGSEADVQKVDWFEQLFNAEAVAECQEAWSTVNDDPWFQDKELTDEQTSTLNDCNDPWARRITYLARAIENINTRGSGGKSLIHLLASCPDGFESKLFSIVILHKYCFEERNVQTNLRCSKGLLPMQYIAETMEHAELSQTDKALYEAMLRVTETFQNLQPAATGLHAAVSEKNIEAVIKLFSGTDPVDVDGLNAYYESPLYLACVNRDESMVRLLLALGADPDMAKPNGFNGLAATSVAIVDALLEAGARPALPKHRLSASTPEAERLNENQGCLRLPLSDQAPFFYAGDTLANVRSTALPPVMHAPAAPSHLEAVSESLIRHRREIVTPPKLLDLSKVPLIEWLTLNLAPDHPVNRIVAKSRGDRLQLFLLNSSAMYINAQFPHLATVDSRDERIRLYAARRKAFKQCYDRFYRELVIPFRTSIYQSDTFSEGEKRLIAEQCSLLTRKHPVLFRCRWRATYNTHTSRTARIESLKEKKTT